MTLALHVLDPDLVAVVFSISFVAVAVHFVLSRAHALLSAAVLATLFVLAWNAIAIAGW